VPAGQLTKLGREFVRVFICCFAYASTLDLGLYREGGSREMFTSDGSDADYFDWRSRSLPMMSSKSCTIVSARSGYRWSIAGCDRALRYVCKLTPSKLSQPDRLLSGLLFIQTGSLLRHDMRLTRFDNFSLKITSVVTIFCDRVYFD